jgi:Sec-independent protein translocase protein TatA
MEFLGIGPLELLFVLLIALIVIGPKDMVKTGRTIGRMLRKVVTSPQWQMINRTSREIRNIPNRLIREAGLEEMQQDLENLKQTTTDIQKTLRESTILPPNQNAIPTKNTNNPKHAATDPAPEQADNQAPPLEPATGDQNVIIPGPSRSQLAGLSAWTTPPGTSDDPFDGSISTGQPNDLSAWISPPVPDPKKSENG